MTQARSSELLQAVGDYDLVCRCADKGCRRLVQIEQEEYEILRSDPRLFVVSPGHEHHCHGDVLVRGDRYVVVRTRERPLELARARRARRPRSAVGGSSHADARSS